MEFYPTKIKENEISDLAGEVKILEKRIEKKETQPPRRYSPASILSELEKRNLGTKATRAAILETLYNRGYIREKSIEATQIGLSLIETLEKYSPIIVNEKLTKDMQDQLDEMIEKSNDKIEELKEKKKEILEEAKKIIIGISKEFENKEKLIGQELMVAQEKEREKEREENLLNLCPQCGKHKLKITYSPKNRRFFVACSGYPACKNTYSLPPRGKISQTGKTCESCGFPLLMTLQKGKKPWIFCFNPKCETNLKRIQEYYKKREEKERLKENL